MQTFASAHEVPLLTAVAVQPGDSNVVLAGGPGQCSGGAFVGGGLYRSTDAGGSWSQVLAAGQINDLIFDPVTPSVVYAAAGRGTSAANAGGPPRR